MHKNLGTVTPVQLTDIWPDKVCEDQKKSKLQEDKAAKIDQIDRDNALIQNQEMEMS